MTYRTETHGNIAVLIPSGQLDLYSAPTFSRQALDALKAGASSLVIDMAEVDYVDSSGIGALLKLFVNSRHENYGFVLCCLQEAVSRVVQLTKLDGYLPVTADRRAAIDRAGAPHPQA